MTIEQMARDLVRSNCLQVLLRHEDCRSHVYNYLEVLAKIKIKKKADCFASIGERNQVHDLVQKAFMNVYNYLKNNEFLSNSERSVKSFLNRVLWTTCMNMVRLKKSDLPIEKSTSIDDTDNNVRLPPVPSPEEQAVNLETRIEKEKLYEKAGLILHNMMTSNNRIIRRYALVVKMRMDDKAYGDIIKEQAYLDLAGDSKDISALCRKDFERGMALIRRQLELISNQTEVNNG